MAAQQFLLRQVQLALIKDQEVAAAVVELQLEFIWHLLFQDLNHLLWAALAGHHHLAVLLLLFLQQVVVAAVLLQRLIHQVLEEQED